MNTPQKNPQNEIIQKLQMEKRSKTIDILIAIDKNGWNSIL